MNESIIKATGLPEEFGLVLLIFSFILTLAPWLSGPDFGIFKVPQFSVRTRTVLRLVGPVFLIAVIAIHLPLLAPPQKEEESQKKAAVSVPPYELDSVNLWKIGGPHSGDVPAIRLPNDVKIWRAPQDRCGSESSFRQGFR